MTNNLLDFEAEPKNDCIGLIFRCRHSAFMTKVGYAENIKMNILKRMSCPGCEKCGGILEMVGEYASDGLLSISVIEDGALYRVNITPAHQNMSGDWDSPEITFVKYKPPTIDINNVIKGQRVKYIPDQANGDPTDKRCELGCIKRMASPISDNDMPAAFVLYDNLDIVMLTGDEPYTAKRTRLENLIFI